MISARTLILSLVLCCITLGACVTQIPTQETPITDDGYQLVWHDEFDQDGPPDPKNWTHELGFVRNQELQWYQTENAYCRDGLLIIEARREKVVNPGFGFDEDHWASRRSHSLFTSSSLMTRGLHQWHYGRFEVRAKITAEDGLWPAIWFLGVEGKWPRGGEIDLMEYYRGNLLANAAWGSEWRQQATWDSARIPISKLGNDQWDESFHIWRMDWDKDSITLSMDGRILNVVDLTRTNNPAGVSPANPFRQGHFLLLSLAIGGTNGGNPAQTEFPSHFEIDYVRVYQKRTDD